MFDVIYSEENSLSTSDSSPLNSTSTASSLTEVDVGKSLLNLAKSLDEAETYLSASKSYISASRRVVHEMKNYAIVAEIDISSAEECNKQLEKKMQAMRLELQPLFYKTMYQHGGNFEGFDESEESLNVSLENSSIPEHVLNTIEKYANSMSLDVNSYTVAYEECEGSSLVIIHPVNPHNTCQKLSESAKTPQSGKRKNDSEVKSKRKSKSIQVPREQNKSKPKFESGAKGTPRRKFKLQEATDVMERCQKEINQQCMASNTLLKGNSSSSCFSRNDGKSIKHVTEKAESITQLSPKDLSKYLFKKNKNRVFPSLSQSTSDLSFIYQKIEKTDSNISDLSQELKMSKEFDYIGEATKLAGTLAENRSQSNEIRFSGEQGAFREGCFWKKIVLNKATEEQRRLSQHFNSSAFCPQPNKSSNNPIKNSPKMDKYFDNYITFSEDTSLEKKYPSKQLSESYPEIKPGYDFPMSNEITEFVKCDEYKRLIRPPNISENAAMLKLPLNVKEMKSEKKDIDKQSRKQQKMLKDEALYSKHSKSSKTAIDRTLLNDAQSMKHASGSKNKLPCGEISMFISSVTPEYLSNRSKNQERESEETEVLSSEMGLMRSEIKLGEINPYKHYNMDQNELKYEINSESSKITAIEQTTLKQSILRTRGLKKGMCYIHSRIGDTSLQKIDSVKIPSNPTASEEKELRSDVVWCGEECKNLVETDFKFLLTKSKNRSDQEEILPDRCSNEQCSFSPFTTYDVSKQELEKNMLMHHADYLDHIPKNENTGNFSENVSITPSRFALDQNIKLDEMRNSREKTPKTVNPVKKFKPRKKTDFYGSQSVKSGKTSERIIPSPVKSKHSEDSFSSQDLKTDYSHASKLPCTRTYSSESSNFKRKQRAKKKAFSRKSIISQIDDSSCFEDYETSNDMIRVKKEIIDANLSLPKCSNFTLETVGEFCNDFDTSQYTKDEFYRDIDNLPDGNFNRLQKNSSPSTSSSRKSKNSSTYVSYQGLDEVDNNGLILLSNSSSDSTTFDNIPFCTQVEYLDTSNKLVIDCSSEVENNFKCTSLSCPTVGSEMFHDVLPNVDSDLAKSASFPSLRDTFYTPSASKSSHHSLEGKIVFVSSLTNRRPVIVNTYQNINSPNCGETVKGSVSVDKYEPSFHSPIRSSSTPIFEARDSSDSDS